SRRTSTDAVLIAPSLSGRIAASRASAGRPLDSELPGPGTVESDAPAQVDHRGGNAHAVGRRIPAFADHDRQLLRDAEHVNGVRRLQADPSGRVIAHEHAPSQME